MAPEVLICYLHQQPKNVQTKWIQTQIHKCTMCNMKIAEVQLVQLEIGVFIFIYEYEYPCTSGINEGPALVCGIVSNLFL